MGRRGKQFAGFKPVILESPYSPKNGHSLKENIAYAKACMADCFRRGEYPYASHLLYTQRGCLDDRIPDQRALGIKAGFYFAELVGRDNGPRVFYTNLGITRGMEEGMAEAKALGQPVEMRTIHWPRWKWYLWGWWKATFTGAYVG